MRDQLSERLEKLKAEFERGRKRLTEVEEEESRLRETLLRISGGIQVLTEELEREETVPAQSNGNAV